MTNLTIDTKHSKECLNVASMPRRIKCLDKTYNLTMLNLASVQYRDSPDIMPVLMGGRNLIKKGGESVVGIKITWIYKVVAGTAKVSGKVLKKVVTGGKG